MVISKSSHVSEMEIEFVERLFDFEVTEVRFR